MSDLVKARNAGRIFISEVSLPAPCRQPPPVTFSDDNRARSASRGMSLVELLIVLAIISIVTAIGLPQILSSRRQFRSAAIPRDIMTQLRNARQQAMSQRVAFTLQYDNNNKQIVTINHGNNPDGTRKVSPTPVSGTAILLDPNYPNNNGQTVSATRLADGGVPATEITYGTPTGAPAGALTDTATLAALAANGRVNVTFQPDGSVINGAGANLNQALFIYNNQSPSNTAFAVSILGTSGRIKLWRYSSNANTYIE